MKVVKAGSSHHWVRSLDVAPFLETEALGRIIELHEQLPSTNDRAARLAKEGAAAGLAVVAHEQTAGRGQRGRTWHSPPGAGLYVSFLTRPKLSPRMAPTLTLVAGVALRAALQPFSKAPLGIKWPNDVLVASGEHFGKKVAGILVEASADAFRIEHAVIGIGVNLKEGPMPPEVAAAAIDLAHLFNVQIELPPVLGAIANEEPERRLFAAEMEGLEAMAKTWSRHAIGAGKEVTIASGSDRITGVLEGIAEDGALQLLTPTGLRPCYRGDLLVPGVPRSA